MDIILASSSFLRKFIMDKSLLEYRSVSPDVDEYQFDDQIVTKRVCSIAEAKCKIVSQDNPECFVIASDTLTASSESGKTYDKRDQEESDPISRALDLSGKTIVVATGISIYHPSFGLKTELVGAKITYQSFDRKTIERLIEADSPFARSGALGIFFDSPGFTLIESIEGSYTGAFGLPMEVVYKYLKLAQ